MQVFLLPISLCMEIERMMNSFWWGSNGVNNKGIKWMSWNKLSMQKSQGGMGFRNLHEFNLAMLGKQGWKLLTDTKSLVARVYRARYFPNGTFLDAELGSNPSYVWRSIMEAQHVKSNARWRIGKGNQVCIWGKPWLGDEQHLYIVSPMPAGWENATVNQLRSVEGNTWNCDILRQLVNE